MAKVRVYELAKELGVESKELLAHLKSMGEFVRSASSPLEPPVVRALRQNPPKPTKEPESPEQQRRRREREAREAWEARRAAPSSNPVAPSANPPARPRGPRPGRNPFDDMHDAVGDPHLREAERIFQQPPGSLSGRRRGGRRGQRPQQQPADPWLTELLMLPGEKRKWLDLGFMGHEWPLVLDLHQCGLRYEDMLMMFHGGDSVAERARRHRDPQALKRQVDGLKGTG